MRPIVELWRALLPADPGSAIDPSILAEWEFAEANRIVSGIEQARFIACRVLRRRILSDYLGVPAEQIRFDSESNGKPRIVAAAGIAETHFNVAHSGDLFVLAASRDLPVGIDVEVIRSVERFSEATERLFDPRERAELAELGAAGLNLRFSERWTAAEALAKLTGNGVWKGLTKGGWPAAVTLIPLSLQPGYVGHVAVKSSRGVQLRDHGWVAL